MDLQIRFLSTFLALCIEQQPVFLKRYLNIDYQSKQDPDGQFVYPWALFPVKVVGEDKCDREGDKDQTGGIEPGNKEEVQSPRQEHIELHLVDVLRHGVHGLKPVQHKDAGNAYKQQYKSIEDIDTKMIWLK